MLKIFRSVAILEGISYLLLFGLTMPLKYWADIGEPNKIVGYAHGILFIAYVVIGFLFWYDRKWGIKKLTILMVASLLPFATFYVDKIYLKELK